MGDPNGLVFRKICPHQFIFLSKLPQVSNFECLHKISNLLHKVSQKLRKGLPMKAWLAVKDIQISSLVLFLKKEGKA